MAKDFRMLQHLRKWQLQYKKSQVSFPPNLSRHQHGAHLIAESIENGHYQPSIIKQMNHYIRKHPFFGKSLATFTKSERRQFERNVYDFARGLGLKRAEARRYVVKAREFCGEEQDDSDNTTFEGEINDSRFILETLSASKLKESAAVSMAIDLPTRQVDGSDKTKAALDIPTNSGEDAASKSAGTDPASRKRKAKAGDVDSDDESARRLLELSNNIPAQQAGNRMDEGQVAQKALKRERKRQKRVEIIKDDRIEPGSDKEYLNGGTNSQETGTREGVRKSEKKGRYPSLNNPLKPKALIGQRDDQLIAGETLRPRKGRKRRKRRIDEMPADAILFSGDGNTKSSTHRNSRSRDTTSDETRAKLLLDLTHPMIQLA